MKTCPNCGKNLPDYARHCKYCETDLPAYQPISVAASQALSCPACGAVLRYDGSSPVVTCDYCGSPVVVPNSLQPKEPPAIPLVEQELPLSEKIEKLVRAGQRETAIRLLRDQVALRLPEAEVFVERIEAGQFVDVKSMLQRALRGEPF